MNHRISNRILVIFVALLIASLISENGGLAFAQIGSFGISGEDIPCCDHNIQAIVWSGNNPEMTIEQLSAYCGPILWFSPDEPLLEETEGREIMLPEPFPFEESVTTPVVYYRIRTILVREDADGPAYVPDSTDRNHGIIDLHQIAGFDLDYFFYYHKEEGMNAHEHDVESAQFKLLVWRRDECQDCPYNLVVTRVVAKAHGVQWYDNILDVDEYARFPMHILVEEGKHASCTDMNGDGYYSPGYDVNVRVNDAWGVRDVMRSGTLFTSQYQGWMTKVRGDEHRVFPPLPEDSPLRVRYSEDGVYAPENATYVLRPFPSAEKADSQLYPFIADKGDPNWPEQVPDTDLTRFNRWVEEEGSYLKSLSIALRADGDMGVSIIFPFFIVKHFVEPLGGGFLVNRIYLKDTRLRDFAWTILYTTSASRWVDGYLSAGIEWDVVDVPTGTETNRNFVLETGVKFRVTMPIKLFRSIIDFLGIRFGIKNTGFIDIDKLTYVFEIGAGAW